MFSCHIVWLSQVSAGSTTGRNRILRHWELEKKRKLGAQRVLTLGFPEQRANVRFSRDRQPTTTDKIRTPCFKAKNPSRVSTFDFRPEFLRSKHGLELSLALDEHCEGNIDTANKSNT